MRNFRICQQCGRVYEVSEPFIPFCNDCKDAIIKKTEKYYNIKL